MIASIELVIANFTRDYFALAYRLVSMQVVNETLLGRFEDCVTDLFQTITFR